jgi:hypothetical protein
MDAIRSTAVRATLATMLLGGLFSVAALAAMPALPATAAGPPSCTDTWNVTASGTYSWSTAADWSKGTVPGTGDVACINKGGTYTVQLIGGTTTIDALVVGSGTSGGSGDSAGRRHLQQQCDSRYR